MFKNGQEVNQHTQDMMQANVDMTSKLPLIKALFACKPACNNRQKMACLLVQFDALRRNIEAR